MYALLADTYRLNATERELLSRIGKEGYSSDAGSETWWAELKGNDPEMFEAFDTMSLKMNAEDNPEKLRSFGLWYRHSACQDFEAGEGDPLRMCPLPHGCGCSMSSGMFPFWPVDDRCATCIRSAVEPSKGLEKTQAAGRHLRDLLKVNSQQSAAVPHLSELVGGVVTEMGGTDAMVREWTSLLKSKDVKATERLKQFKVLAGFIGQCNQAKKDEWSELDKMTHDQIKDRLIAMMTERLTKDQIQTLLKGVDDVEPHEIKGIL